MEHFRKIWDEEKNNFLLKNKDLPRKERYKLFIEKWPDSGVTFDAFNDHSSRIGACVKRKNPWSTKIKKIGSEHQKKGYVKIKVADPNVWMFKHHYVWFLNTGYKPNPKTDIVIFLDGNIRNFDFDNLYLIPRKLMGILNNPKNKLGIVRGNAKATRINIENAKLIHTAFNVGRKLGLVGKCGRFKEDINEYAQNKRQTEKNKKRIKEYIKKKWQETKNDPEKLKKLHEYRREYYKKNKAKIIAKRMEYYRKNGK